jgi:hypothetical protein
MFYIQEQFLEKYCQTIYSTNSVKCLISYFFKIYFNIILPSPHLGLSSGCFFHYKSVGICFLNNQAVCTKINIILNLTTLTLFSFIYLYCHRFAPSTARQRLSKHPATDVHSITEGRPSLGHARNMHSQQQEECFLLLGSSQRTNGLAG